VLEQLAQLGQLGQLAKPVVQLLLAENPGQMRATSSIVQLGKKARAMTRSPFATQTSLVVLQPTPFCNIDCKYCYLPDRRNKDRMPLPMVERVFSKLVEFPTIKRDLTVVWHAGEPLVVPPDYYREAFAIIDRLAAPKGLAVRHSFQSNGTLVNDAWCDLIAGSNVSMGISIDGPRDLNDLNRVSRAGRSTFDATMRGIRCLQARQIDFHTISVITSSSLDRAKDLYDFFVDNDILRVAFNVEEQEGVHLTSSIGEDDFVERYREFYFEFCNLILAGERKLSFRELESALRAIRGASPDCAYSDQALPFAIVSIDYLGNVSTFSPELLGVKNAEYMDFNLGNIVHRSFQQMTESDAFLRLSGDICDGVSRCRETCSYFPVCGGGAPANKLFENGSLASAETRYCQTAQQIPIQHALALIATHRAGKAEQSLGAAEAYRW
jgi:uncharacterized protein